MEIQPIKTEQDYDAALRAIEALWNAPEGSSEANRLEILITLNEAYEATHHPIGPPDPIEAIKFRMEQEGLSLQDLAPYLSRKRPLTLAMMRRVHHARLRVPLAAPEPTQGSGTAKRCQRWTPAMAAGVTNRVWSLREVLLFRVLPWPQLQAL
jgi:HTH-type transcriptional regulator / antitoxin HigA